MIIPVPDNTHIYDFSTSKVWLDKKGILYSAAKPGPAPLVSTESIREEVERLKQIVGNKKICLIIESNSRSSSPTKEQRDMIAEAFISFTKAMAIISSSPLSRMAANLFFSFKPPPYPYKMFATLADAQKWISQYLDD